jgi:hypothetical protein
MAKLCDEGEALLADYALKTAAAANLYLGLFTDIAEPAEDITLATITELPVANGYARIALAKADWTIAGTAPCVASQLQKTFTCITLAWGNVYGYFICDAASGVVGNLIAVETFSDGPYNVVVDGVIKISPKLNWS